MRRLSFLVLIVTVAGCATAGSSESSGTETLEEITVVPREPEPHTEPTPVPTTVEPTATEPTCDVGFVTQARDDGSGHIRVFITARNQAAHPVAGTLVTRCPGPSAHVRGLPPNYVIGGTCTMGACAEPSTEEPFELAVGEERVVARLAIATRGDSCNAALPVGSYRLGGSVELRGVGSCVVAAASVDVANVEHTPAVDPQRRPPPTHERCPAVACAYNPCPPGVSPPPGCAGQCGCPGSRGGLQEE